MRWEILDAQGEVLNTIVASREFMERNFASSSYRAAKDVEVVEQPEALLPRHITPLALLRRLTVQEEVALEMASIDNGSANLDQRAQAAAVRIAMRRMTAARFIDLDDPEVLGTLQQFEAAGLLAPGRAQEIVSTQVQPQERA